MLFTLGHSNHNAEKFLSLLRTHEINLVADVRSQPVSRFSPHFRKANLGPLLSGHGIGYLWLDSLGGRPKNPELLDESGRPDYAKMAQTEGFQRGLERLLQESEKQRTTILCGEEDPNHCHRRLLVVRALCERNPEYAEEVWHIRKDGKLQSESELMRPQASQPGLI
ncbi:MAG: hypothetical protein C4327_15110 [Meiothermus sp.]